MAHVISQVAKLSALGPGAITFLRSLAEEPLFPHSVSVLGSLLAPVALHNHLTTDLAWIQDSRSAPPDRIRAQREDIKLTESLKKQWTLESQLAAFAHLSTYSRRYRRVLGGNVRDGVKTARAPWAVAVLDTDSSSERDGLLGLKFCSSSEGWLLRESGRWKHDVNTGLLDDLGQSEGLPGTSEMLFWTNQLLGQVLTDLAPLRRPLLISSVSQLHLAAIEQYVSTLRIRPRIKRTSMFTRFILPSDSPILAANTVEERKAVENMLGMSIKGVFKADLSLLREVGMPETEQYYLKGLPFTSAFRPPEEEGPGTFVAWVLMNNDLSLTAPFVVPTHEYLGLANPLLSDSIRRIRAALSQYPGGPYGSFLAEIKDTSLPLHARVPVTAEPIKATFRRAGWKEVIGGICDVELDGWEEMDYREWRAERKERRMANLSGTNSTLRRATGG